MMMQHARRGFLRYFAVLVLVAPMWGSVNGQAVAAEQAGEYVIGYLGVGDPSSRVAHVSGFIRADGTGEHYPDFDQPNQLSWVLGPEFSDGRRMLVTSYEDTNETKVRAGKVKTHIWIYDMVTDKVEKVFQKGRLSDQMRAQAVLPGDQRAIVSAIIGSEQRVFVMDLDGGNQVELTEAGGGFHYVLSLSSDSKRLACHVTGGKPSFYNPGPYSVNVLDLATKKRVLVAGQPEHLYFGPTWSPDDRWLVYMDCLSVKDPHHFQAAVCIGRSDGSDHRVVTEPQTHWFGTPYGSNMPVWSPDGKTVTYTRLLANAERDMSRGGAQLCLVNPFTGKITELTSGEEGKWDFRGAWSPDGRKLVFTRVRQGGARELWVMDADGRHQKRLTQGYEKRGADFSRWIRVSRAKP